MIVSLIFMIAVGGCALTAAFTDFRWRKIPNKLTVPVALAGLVFHLALWALKAFGVLVPADGADGFAGMQTWLLAIGPWTFAGLAVGLGVLLLPAILGGGGFGDVKLFAALGAWLGVNGVLIAFVLSILVAAVFAIVVMAAKGPARMLRRLKKIQRESKQQRGSKARKRPKSMLPFAVPSCFGIGIFLVLFCMNAIDKFWSFFI